MLTSTTDMFVSLLRLTNGKFGIPTSEVNGTYRSSAMQIERTYKVLCRTSTCWCVLRRNGSRVPCRRSRTELMLETGLFFFSALKSLTVYRQDNNHEMFHISSFWVVHIVYLYIYLYTFMYVHIYVQRRRVPCYHANPWNRLNDRSNQRDRLEKSNKYLKTPSTKIS